MGFLKGNAMKTINSELVTVDINGKTFDCFVSGYYYEHNNSFDLEYLFTKLPDGTDQEIDGLLSIEDVRDDIIEQLKGMSNEI